VDNYRNTSIDAILWVYAINLGK